MGTVKQITMSELREACMGAEGEREERFVENFNRNQGYFSFQVELN